MILQHYYRGFNIFRRCKRSLSCVSLLSSPLSSHLKEFLSPPLPPNPSCATMTPSIAHYYTVLQDRGDPFRLLDHSYEEWPQWKVQHCVRELLIKRIWMQDKKRGRGISEHTEECATYCRSIHTLLADWLWRDESSQKQERLSRHVSHVVVPVCLRSHLHRLIYSACNKGTVLPIKWKSFFLHYLRK